MNYFSLFRQSGVLKKTLSMIALAALAAGGLSGLAYTSTVYANNGVNTYAVPNSGTLAPGQNLEVHFTVGLDPNDTNPVTSSSCLINGVEVKDTFTNLTSGTNGHFKVTYTVGAGDASRAAGQVPINCTLSQTGQVTVTGFDDGNTVAIDTAGGGGNATTTPSAPALSLVGVTPSSGMISLGQSAEVRFTESSGQTDLTLTGSCKVNVADVAGTFQNLGGGVYKVTYTVASGDGERPAGYIPVSCTLGNSAGNVTANAWNDGNSLAVDTNGDGTIDNGTNNLGFTVTASPDSGMLTDGQSLVVSMQDPLPSGDVVIGQNGCRVNGVDVSGTYAYQGNGLYKVTYTVAPGHVDRAAGEVPVDCSLQNQTGSVHLVEFTDNNTVAVNASDATVISSVTANPHSGTLGEGDALTIDFQLTNSDAGYTMTACSVNNVSVLGTTSNLGNGRYRVSYNVGQEDANRSAGTIPINCTLQKTGSTLNATAFTDNNTVAISIGAGTGTGTTSPSISSVSVVSGPTILELGDVLEVYIQANKGGLVVGGACTVNERDVSGTFADLAGGLYRLLYTVGAIDSDRAPGTIPIFCVIKKPPTGATATTTAFTDGNMKAIDVNGNGIATSTGTTGTTTGQIGGDVTGGATTTNGVLHVDSITQIRTTATAGGGFDGGWEWIFNVTVPTNEPTLSMKFDNWTHSNGSTTIPAANNMRISTDQDNATSTTMITAANTYSTPFSLTGDLNPGVPGRQIQIKVEAQVPAGSLNGSYTTNYGIQSIQ